MGSAAGVIADDMPEGLKELFDLTERQKTKIAEIDAAMLDVEMGKLFKGHNKIIDDLTARSKSQLKFMFDKFPTAGKHLEALVAAGNPYAKFIQQLAVPKLQLEMEMLKADEFDEELLVNLIGTSTTRELKELNELYTQEKGFSIANTFATKGKDNASLCRVVQTIFRFLRDESKDIDQDLAERQAETIHKAGPMRLIGVDEDTFFDILLTASRSQCYAINEAYQRLFKMKLERAINMKFRGNLSRLLVLWSMPLSSSIMTALNLMTQRMLVDKAGICSFLARYDKDTLKTVDAASKELQRKPFADLLGGSLGGTTHRAVKGWIESASPDKGFDRIVHIYIDQKLNLSSTPTTLAELLTDPEMQNKLHFLLDKQAAELKLFLIDHKVKVDPSDQAIMARSSASIGSFSRSNTVGRGALRTSPSNVAMTVSKVNSPKSSSALAEVEEEEETPLKMVRSPIKRKFSILAIEDNDMKVREEAAEIRQQLVNHTYTYLLSIFEDADVDEEGSLDVELFWSTAKELPLTALGFDAEEIDEIRANSAWEQENRVFYFEALMEFAESCVTSIQDKNPGEAEHGNDVKQVINALIAQREAAKDRLGAYLHSFHNDVDKLTMIAASSRRRSSFNDALSHVPGYFIQYVFDTVAAFDFNSCGRLGLDEITALVQALNVSTLTPDIFLSKINNDGNAEEVVIEFKQASDLIVREVQPWFKDGQDHFICLVDKMTGAYFWYNTKDESSQWVDEANNNDINNTNTTSSNHITSGVNPTVTENDEAYGKDIMKVDSLDAKAASLVEAQQSRGSSSSSKKRLAMSQSAPAIFSTEEPPADEADAKGE